MLSPYRGNSQATTPSTSGKAILVSMQGLIIASGVPDNADGSNGDFYLRTDGTVAGNTVIYHKEGGSWVACTTA